MMYLAKDNEELRKKLALKSSIEGKLSIYYVAVYLYQNVVYNDDEVRNFRRGIAVNFLDFTFSLSLIFLTLSELVSLKFNGPNFFVAGEVG